MSSGVTGKCGDMEGVWIDPVMAQVMMVFDLARMRPGLASFLAAAQLAISPRLG
jgi:hypothetical protein